MGLRTLLTRNVSKPGQGSSLVRRTAVVRNVSDHDGGGVWVSGYGGHQLHNMVFLENSLSTGSNTGVGLHVGNAADVRNSIFVGHSSSYALDNLNAVNTGGYNTYANNLDGDVREPYTGDILGGSVIFTDEGAACSFDLSLAAGANPDAADIGDPDLASIDHPKDRGLFGGLGDGELDSDGDLFPDVIDCAPFDASVYPGAAEQCNGLDDDCDGAVPSDELDSDGDGYAACDGDCDDTEATAYPGGPLIVGDDVDNDCDGVGECYRDGDNDGFGTSEVLNAPANVCDFGLADVSGDCDDGEDSAYPGATEVCDGIDNDCDDDIDDDDSSVTGQTTAYADVDGDGHGDPASALTSCDIPSTYVDSNTDCDDLVSTINPSYPEIACDGIDNDCDPASLDDLGCDTGDTGVPADTDTDTDTPGFHTKTPEPTDPDYGCGCISGSPVGSAGLALLPSLAFLGRRRMTPS